MLAVPGIAASVVLYRPDRMSLLVRLASFLAFGYAIAALIATVLTNLRVMRPAVFFVVLVLVTAVLWFLALRRRGTLREHWRAMATQARADPWPLLLGAVVIVVIAVVRWRFSPLVNFGHTEPWRYWADAQEIARVGGVPATAIHYGAPYPPTVSKIILNTFNAGVIFTVGSAPLAPMGALAWLASLGGNLGLWAVGRELGLRFTAPLLVIFTQAEARWNELGPTTKIVFHYTAAYVAAMVALSALALGVRAVRDPRAKEVVVVGLLFAAAAGTHLIPAVVLLTLLGWYAIGYVLVHRAVVKPVVTVLAIGVLAGGTTVAAIATSGGDVGFQGAGGPNRYGSFPRTFDPTLYLAKGVVDPPLKRQPDVRQRLQHGWYVTPGHVLIDYVDSGLPFKLDLGWSFAFAAASLALAVLILLRFPMELRPLGVAAWGFVATLVVVALGFSYVYTTLVPGTFGLRRLDVWAPYAFMIVGLAVLEAGIGWLARLGPKRRDLIGLGVVAVIAFLFIPLSSPPSEKLALDRASLNEVEWIRHNVPPDARLVTNRRTAATFAATVGRVSITEGMTPYLRPAMLKPVVDLLIDVRHFFKYPKTPRHRAFLEREGVSYVVFIKENVLGSDNDVPVNFPLDETALEQAPYLHLVHRGRVADIYEVMSP
jgi:hypothetical protein